MPNISNVTLRVITGGATPIISVIYLISPIGHESEHGEQFFETVELFGEDSLADGEDGTNERIRPTAARSPTSTSIRRQGSTL